MYDFRSVCNYSFEHHKSLFLVLLGVRVLGVRLPKALNFPGTMRFGERCYKSGGYGTMGVYPGFFRVFAFFRSSINSAR